MGLGPRQRSFLHGLAAPAGAIALPINYILKSQAMGTSPWTNSNSAVTVSGTAPDGTATANVLTDNVANNAHYTIQSVTIPAAGSYVFSMYLKAGTSSSCNLWSSSGAYVTFNLSTGAVTNVGGSALNATITASTGSWYRASFSFSYTAASFNFACIDNPSATNTAIPTYVGTGLTLNLWGAQLNVGTLPSTYRPNL